MRKCISEDGVILGTSGRIVKGNKKFKRLSNHRKIKKYLIHCLIAECWIDCPGDFCSYQVNHIDGNKIIIV